MVAIVFHLAIVLVALVGVEQDVKGVWKKMGFSKALMNLFTLLAVSFSWVQCALCTRWLCWKKQLFLSYWLAWCTLWPRYNCCMAQVESNNTQCLFYPTAICFPPDGCLNGGHCVTPGHCSCPTGWSGEKCDEGIITIMSPHRPVINNDCIQFGMTSELSVAH